MKGLDGLAIEELGMKRLAWGWVVVALTAPASAQMAPDGQACRPAHSAEALSEVVVPDAINARLLDQAMRMEVNLARCVQGVSPVEASDDLAKAATLLAFSTARPGVSIASSEAMQGSDAVTRAAAAGFTAVGLENTGWFPWMRMVEGNLARDWTLGPCGYRDAKGEPVRAFTYAAFAQEVVGLMARGGDSAETLLHPDIRAMGTGVGHSSDGAVCGTLYVVQSFGG